LHTVIASSTHDSYDIPNQIRYVAREREGFIARGKRMQKYAES